MKIDLSILPPKEVIDANEKLLRENRNICALITVATQKALNEMGDAAKMMKAAAPLLAQLNEAERKEIEDTDLVAATLRNNLGRLFALGFTYAQQLADAARKAAEAAEAAARG